MQAQAQTPPPQPAKTQPLADAIVQKFPGTTVEYVREKRLKVTTTPEKIKEVAFFVRDELGFDHISCVSGTDWIAKNEIEVIYFVGSVSKPGQEAIIVALAERPKRDNPDVPTLIDVWPDAEYHERETHGMPGVDFARHANAKQLLVPEAARAIPPLRKAYVLP